MRVFVTGATGGLGRNAVEGLLAAGHEPVATGRTTVIGSSLGVEFIGADLVNCPVSELEAMMAGCEAVWHCAALSSPWGSYKAFYDSNVYATEKLTAAAVRTGIPRFVHISTPAVYFDYKHHHGIDESYRASRFANSYARTKYLAEMKIKALVPLFPETCFQILRPRGLFGKYDAAILPRILALLAQYRGKLPLPGGGKALLDLTYTENVVHAMHLATVRENLVSGDIYNITNGQPAKLIEILGLLLDEMDRPYRVRAVPYPLLYALSGMMEAVSRFTKKEPKLTRYSAGVLYYDMVLDNGKAEKILGYKPVYTIDEGIKRTAAWFKEASHG